MKKQDWVGELVGTIFGLMVIAVFVIAVGLLCRVTTEAVNWTSAQVANNPCFADKTSVECRVQRVDECLATERFTEDQCVNLVGGGGK